MTVLTKYVLRFSTALAILALLKHAVEVSFSSALELILTQYENVKVLVLSGLQIDFIVLKITSAISELFNLELNVYPHWSDVFVLLLLYLFARVVAYWTHEMRGMAKFRFVWLAVVSLLTSVAAGIVDPLHVYGNTLILVSVVCGLAIFDVVDAAWSATFYRKLGLRWSEDWRRYARYSMPTIALGFVLSLLFFLTYPIWSADWIRVPGLVALFIYSFFLAVYWIWRGIQSSRASHRHGTGYEKFRASSNTTIGMSMLESLGAACAIWAVDAGASLLGGATLLVRVV